MKQDKHMELGSKKRKEKQDPWHFVQNINGKKSRMENAVLE
jgi:hypothetical protein